MELHASWWLSGLLLNLRRVAMRQAHCDSPARDILHQNMYYFLYDEIICSISHPTQPFTRRPVQRHPIRPTEKNAFY
jgi:hypothetical protein